MVETVAENEWIDGARVTLEVLTAVKRAGSGMIFRYHAREVARWLTADQWRLVARRGAAMRWNSRYDPRYRTWYEFSSAPSS